ncbi:adenylate/guanylate cyclase domain-containing protein [Mycobacterium sp. NPDC048908]|uniref:adenylate/guanylate cyclase domain-containing protein n=1 Tax=Mycobacterium sp. NPDC048908 TaxID=3364292 RepID=UPI003721C6E1
MDRIWQWAWDRYGHRYSWALWALTSVAVLLPYVTLSAMVVAFQRSDSYVEAAAVTVVAVPLLAYGYFLPGWGPLRLAEQRARGRNVDRTSALEATYATSRGVVARGLTITFVWGAALFVIVGLITGATWSRLIQYGLLGASLGVASSWIGVHSIAEGALRPARVAIAGDTDIGDALPRSRPTFAAWSNMSMLAVAFGFAVGAAMLGAAFDPVRDNPALAVVIGGVGIIFAAPITVGFGFAPSLRPVRDLAEGTERVAAGDYSRRLPVVQDDDLGALTASFNRMQAGLVDRQRLQAAFGAYVDPALAARILEQGDDVFTGERREVTVMFVDVRDFTPFAEANTAEDTVARLNALFEIVVPAVVDAGGHVNKFLGDGALAVFGAPNVLVTHADAAITAAVQIHRLVNSQFNGELRVGIGINTGVVIAGTIGAAGHLEFSLIGDTTNVAARVEQLTKTTGDAILLTEQCMDAVASRPAGLIDRGVHALKGKAAAVHVFGLDPTR